MGPKPVQVNSCQAISHSNATNESYRVQSKAQNGSRSRGNIEKEAFLRLVERKRRRIRRFIRFCQYLFFSNIGTFPYTLRAPFHYVLCK